MGHNIHREIGKRMLFGMPMPSVSELERQIRAATFGVRFAGDPYVLTPHGRRRYFHPVDYVDFIHSPMIRRRWDPEKPGRLLMWLRRKLRFSKLEDWMFSWDVKFMGRYGKHPIMSIPTPGVPQEILDIIEYHRRQITTALAIPRTSLGDSDAHTRQRSGLAQAVQQESQSELHRQILLRLQRRAPR